jgi:uncharacterized protein YbcV (DUF1398 family)
MRVLRFQTNGWSGATSGRGSSVQVFLHMAATAGVESWRTDIESRGFTEREEN